MMLFKSSRRVIPDEEAGERGHEDAVVDGVSPERKSHWKMVKDLVENGMEKYEEIEHLPAKQVTPNFIFERRKDFLAVELRLPGESTHSYGRPDASQRHKFRLIPVLHPGGTFHFRWDLAQVACLIYVSILVPMRLGFDWSAIGPWYLLETLIDLYFFGDFFVNLFTAIPYVEQGEEQMEEFCTLEIRKLKIASHYLKGWFLIDFLAFMPVDLISRGLANSLWCSFKLVGSYSKCRKRETGTGSAPQALKIFKISRAFRVLKLFRLVKLKRLVKKYQDALLFWMPLIQASKLFFLLVFAAHWIGCMYASVYPFEEEYTFGEKYVAMVYWAMQTITTVGYGDLTSNRTDCRAVATLAMALGGLIFGWLMQYVLHVLDPDTFERKQEARIERLVAYLGANTLPFELSTRVIRHVRQQNGRQTEDRNALDNVPRQLRNEVFYYLYCETIRKAPLLSGIKKTLIGDLSSKIYPLVIFKDEMVYGENDLAQEGTYIVSSGRVELSISTSDALTAKTATRRRRRKSTTNVLKLETLSDGDIFGEGSAFACARRHERAVAVATSDLLTVSGSDFRECLEMNPALRWRVLIHFVEHVSRLAIGNPYRAAKVMSDLQLPELLSRRNKLTMMMANLPSSSMLNKPPEHATTLKEEDTAFSSLKDDILEFRPNWKKLMTSTMRLEWEERHRQAHDAERQREGEAIAAAVRVVMDEFRSSLETDVKTALEDHLAKILRMGLPSSDNNNNNNNNTKNIGGEPPPTSDAP